MYKVLLFDFFDVLYTDLYRAWLESRGYKREGIFLEVVQSLDRGVISADEFHQKLGDIVGRSASEVRVEMRYGATCNQELLEYIQTVRATYRISLISNAASSSLRAILQHHKIEQYFDEVIISSEVGVAKPDRQIFEITLDRLRASPDEVLFIDDNPNNIAAAEKMGIHGVQYTDNASLFRALQNEGVTLES